MALLAVAFAGQEFKKKLGSSCGSGGEPETTPSCSGQKLGEEKGKVILIWGWGGGVAFWFLCFRAPPWGR